MSRFWQAFEGVPKAAAARSWQRRFGAAYVAAAKLCLCDTDRGVTRVLCEQGCRCSHRVWKRAGRFVGVCDCGEGCDDIPLTEAEVKVWKLDIEKLGFAVATALRCEARSAEVGLPHTRQIASLGSAPLPILLTIAQSEDGFTDTTARLVARWPKGFVLLAPTRRFCAAPATELLSRINAGFYDLASNLTLQADGQLVAPQCGEVLFAEQLSGHTHCTVPANRAAVRNSFRKAGSHWDITFDGHEAFHLSHTFGAEYLNYLLHHPSEPISAYELERTIRPEKVNARSKDSVQSNLDADAVRDYLRQLDTLRMQRDEASEDGDLAKVDRLDADIEAIENELKKNGQAPDAGERSRGNVSKAIAAVKQKLRKGDTREKAFGQHLEQFISLGYQCTYNQPQENRWG